MVARITSTTVLLRLPEVLWSTASVTHRFTPRDVDDVVNKVIKDSDVLEESKVISCFLFCGESSEPLLREGAARPRGGS